MADGVVKMLEFILGHTSVRAIPDEQSGNVGSQASIRRAVKAISSEGDVVARLHVEADGVLGALVRTSPGPGDLGSRRREFNASKTN